jgi:hypothetical protein
MSGVDRFTMPSMGMRPARPQIDSTAGGIPLSFIGLAAFICGLCIDVRLEVVGEVYLVEPLLCMLALQRVLSRGAGSHFVPSAFTSFLVAGLLTFCGYLLADLVAANEPWQYLKGWGRVALLIVDCAALMIVAAQGRKVLWWLVLGIGIGGIASLLLQGVPLTQWKLGYAEYVALLVVTLSALAPPLVSIPLIGGFGAFCIAVDYRSLGAACVLVAGAMVWQAMGRRQSRAAWLRGLGPIALFVIVGAALLFLLGATKEDYRDRREASTVGRYVVVMVALRAISESPLVGYGSWAIADQNYTRMIRDEVQHRVESSSTRQYAEDNLVRSLMPHSQLIQVWLEGGILGLSFFLLYGARIARALQWFTMRHPLDAVAPLYVFFLVEGAWNLVASPFLGSHRVHIAITVAICMLAIYQRNRERASGRRAGTAIGIPASRISPVR